jgi:hypothetical protein
MDFTLIGIPTHLRTSPENCQTSVEGRSLKILEFLLALTFTNLATKTNNDFIQ